MNVRILIKVKNKNFMLKVQKVLGDMFSKYLGDRFLVRFQVLRKIDIEKTAFQSFIQEMFYKTQ